MVVEHNVWHSECFEIIEMCAVKSNTPKYLEIQSCPTNVQTNVKMVINTPHISFVFIATNVVFFFYPISIKISVNDKHTLCVSVRNQVCRLFSSSRYVHIFG